MPSVQLTQQAAALLKEVQRKAETFSFDVDDFDALQQKDQKLEVRLFNAEGVPAQRVILPFRDVSWADQ